MADWLGHGAGVLAPTTLRRWRSECERAGADCAERVEAIALRLAHVHARRQGESLRVFTRARTLEFVDGDGPAHHRYLGLREACGSHMVARSVGGVLRFLLISHASGEQTEHEALPV